MLSIQPHDLVLEIGSGNRPRKRSDVLCDRFPEDSYQRGGQQALLLDGRPFVVADGAALPFKDGAFQYVIVSHVLEHVEDPQIFARELARVAGAGYVETPSELGEHIFGWPFHRWIARLEGDTVVLRSRKADSVFGSYFHEMYARDPMFAEFVDARFSDFYVQHEWRGRLKVRIDEDDSPAVKFNRYEAPLDVRPPYRVWGARVLRALLRFPLRVLKHFRKVV